jgi:hypothetical protein
MSIVVLLVGYLITSCQLSVYEYNKRLEEKRLCLVNKFMLGQSRGTEEIPKIFSQDSRCAGRGRNRVPPDYKMHVISARYIHTLNLTEVPQRHRLHVSNLVYSGVIKKIIKH